MKQCPACKEKVANDAPIHKVKAYDTDPSFGMGPRVWVCEKTALFWKKITGHFDSCVDPGEWFGWDSIPDPPAPPPPVDREAVTTLHGTPIDKLKEDQAKQPVGMHADYIVLTEEERAKGFVRPVRQSYQHVGPPAPRFPLRDLTPEEHERYDKYGYVKFERHLKEDGTEASTGQFYTQQDLANKGCGSVTTMGRALAETYARDPKFYGATMCVHCNKHIRVGEFGEFVWAGTTERVGT